MSENSRDVSLSFHDVRKLSHAQINKLTKNQLTYALKNAISSSGSVNDQPQITTESLKNMISDAVSRVREDLLKEQQRLFASLEQKMEKRISEICTKVDTLTNDFEKKCDLFMNAMDAEFEDRMSRRSNVILYGVEEAEASADADSRKAHDMSAFNRLLKTMDISEDPTSFKLRRFGVPTANKCRLLHVRCPDNATRDNLLRSRTKLRFLDRKVFVQPDLTRVQQERARDLRLELKNRRERGEDVIIRNNMIVPLRKR